jgi:hypothetical protein
MYAGSHIKRVLLLFDVNKNEINKKILSENFSINFNANPLFWCIFNVDGETLQSKYYLLAAVSVKSVKETFKFVIAHASWILCQGKALPVQAWTGFQEVQAPRFSDNRHIKVVRLSALRTSRLYSQGNNPGNHNF